MEDKIIILSRTEAQYIDSITQDEYPFNDYEFVPSMKEKSIAFRKNYTAENIMSQNYPYFILEMPRGFSSFLVKIQNKFKEDLKSRIVEGTALIGIFAKQKDVLLYVQPYRENEELISVIGKENFKLKKQVVFSDKVAADFKNPEKIGPYTVRFDEKNFKFFKELTKKTESREAVKCNINEQIYQVLNPNPVIEKEPKPISSNPHCEVVNIYAQIYEVMK